MIKTLYIVRHGETDLNKQGIVQGRGINTSLNDIGRTQAEAFYQVYKDVKFDKLYTSTLQRTHQTMAHFIQDGLSWVQLSGLDEMDWGKYEGVASSPEMRAFFKSLTDQWAAGVLGEHFEGGESPLDVNKRQKEALDEIMSFPEEKNVLICMHGRAIRLFLCLLLNDPLSHMDHFPHQNLSLYKVAFKGDHFELLEFNNVVHLDPDSADN